MHAFILPVTLNLLENGFTGELPMSFYNLSSLERVLMNSNEFTGAISPEIGGLTNLKWFLVKENNFNGTITPNFDKLLNLGELFAF